VINSNDARFLAKDKFFSLQKLSAHHLPIPKTVLLKGIPD
jgi:glutathione synthase/RimK-type ligase-like ATP-grasp enzyme